MSQRGRVGRMHRGTSAIALTLALAIGCGRGSPATPPPSQTTSVTVGRENIAVVDSGVIRSGPMISGSLEPEVQANVRAEIAGQVLQTYAEQGDSVRKGQLLARIDDTALRQAALSAESAVRSAQTTLDNAQRDLARNQRLYQAGAIAERDLQSSQQAVTSAQAAVANAKSNLALAQQQLSKATVQAPFTGIVSQRSVNAGDAVQPGGALFTIVDPSSMRLEAAVPAAQLSAIRMGQPVRFTVTGYPDRTFTGRISRISPAANPATRQVEIYATIPNTGHTLVAGLYAQGTVASESQTGLIAPATAIDQSGLTPTVMRIRQGKAQEVQVQLGLRDPQTNEIVLKSGVSAGDTLLLGSAAGITPGTVVHVVATPNEATAQK
ncbi:MAG TPA: efflux RND transporter periplasmic adaptor subunit [Gemmatimonadaceae bacterium]|nr:efflux RND transporter periplasmic adaptor subunit [Gemmatimonadaceae bacterium]